MKISIVMPVYNSEKYLEESINSVIKQSSENWELVIIDDGSTDKSAEICDDYSEKYKNIIVYHKQNEGQFLSRKIGIEKATGEYIGFLDSDDILDDNYISELLTELEENEYPDVICFGFCRFSEKGLGEKFSPADKCYLLQKKEERKGIYLQIIEGRLSGSLCSKLFKKNLLFENFNDSKAVCESRFGEDAYQSFSAIGVAESIYLLDKCLYCYRENPMGASEGFDKRNFDYFNTKYVFDLLLNFLPVWGLCNDEIKNMLYARNFNETVYYFLRYFRESKSLNRKIDIVKYNWQKYMMDDFSTYITDNHFVRKSYIPIWKDICECKVFSIFFREFLRKF